MNAHQKFWHKGRLMLNMLMKACMFYSRGFIQALKFWNYRNLVPIQHPYLHRKMFDWVPTYPVYIGWWHGRGFSIIRALCVILCWFSTVSTISVENGAHDLVASQSYQIQHLTDGLQAVRSMMSGPSPANWQASVKCVLVMQNIKWMNRTSDCTILPSILAP